jgi:UrcA family protein
MYTETNLPDRSSLESAVLTAALIALCAIAPIKVMADTQPAPAAETLAAKVSLADLDLSTSEGQRVAYERLHQSARRLCWRLEIRHLESLAHRPTYIRCVDEALADALRQLDALRQVRAPALASVQGSHDTPR